MDTLSVTPAIAPEIALPETEAELERGVGEGLHPGAQVYLSVAGRGSTELVIGERAAGQAMTGDTLLIWLSATKPVAAVAIAQLWEAGKLDLDDPIARHVPAFAVHGKDRITIRHALTHTGGFRMLSVGWPQAPWAEIIDTICSRKPEPGWTPGEKAGYHMQSSWFMLGEIVRRIDGRTFDRYVREQIFEPIGMADSWVGMPRERLEAYGDRIGLMHATDVNPPRARGWNRPPHVVGCSPGGNGHGPARDLGRFYEMLLADGTWGGRRILRPQTVAALVAAHRWGMVDRTFRHELVWGLGFILKSPGDEPTAEAVDDEGVPVPYGFGRWASRRVFGHSGAQSSVALADPTHGLVAVVLTNGQPGEARHSARQRRVLEALYRDLGFAGGPA